MKKILVVMKLVVTLLYSYSTPTLSANYAKEIIHHKIYNVSTELRWNEILAKLDGTTKVNEPDSLVVSYDIDKIGNILQERSPVIIQHPVDLYTVNYRASAVCSGSNTDKSTLRNHKINSNKSNQRCFNIKTDILENSFKIDFNYSSDTNTFLYSGRVPKGNSLLIKDTSLERSFILIKVEAMNNHPRKTR